MIFMPWVREQEAHHSQPVRWLPAALPCSLRLLMTRDWVQEKRVATLDVPPIAGSWFADEAPRARQALLPANDLPA